MTRKRKQVHKKGKPSKRIAKENIESDISRSCHLPDELWIRISIYALANSLDQLVPRQGMKALPGLRFRYNQTPTLWSAMAIKPSTMTEFESTLDMTDWFNILRLAEHAQPIDYGEFGFGLFSASRQLSAVSIETFLKSTHLVFDTRLDFHEFVDMIGVKAKYLRSITINLKKSKAPHDQQILNKYKEWNLMNSSQGPSIVITIEKVRDSCTNLKYLEFFVHNNTYPSNDNKAMRKYPDRYSQWPWVQALCSLKVEKFKFLEPGRGWLDKWSAFHDEVRSKPFHATMNERFEIEAFVNENLKDNQTD